MAPAVNTREKKKDKGKGNFAVRGKAGGAKGEKDSSIKKAKSRAVPKKKLKNQTTKWIEDVDQTFTVLHSQLANKSTMDKQAADKEKRKQHKEVKQSNKKEHKRNLQSEVTQEQLSSTITDMVKLL